MPTTTGAVRFSRVILTEDPFVDWRAKWSGRGTWPARWIGHPQVQDSDTAVVAFRRNLVLEQSLSARIHVTADERYELFINGKRVGRGSERGSPENWYYESFDLFLPPGKHTILARTWRLGHDGPAPCAQMSLRPGFLFAAQGEGAHEALSTGAAAWEAARLDGYEFTWQYPTELPFTGARVRMRGKDITWEVETGLSGRWVPAREIGPAVNASMAEEQPENVWLLRPSTLPPPHSALISAGTCRHIESVESDSTESVPVDPSKNIGAEQPAWNSLLSAHTLLTVPAGLKRRVILDLGDYYCGYPQLTVSGGRESVVRIGWTESLYEHRLENAGGYRVPPKGNRGEIHGKYFRGFADVFEPDGGEHRRFQPLWWSAGRYVEVYVQTGAQALRIEGLDIEEMHYPYEWRGTFEASDPRLSSIIPMCKRTLEMCSHETYMDCPYYEQLMYIGDTRVEVLQTYAMTGDDRLPRKALVMFDLSRRISGLTQSRYPTRVRQIIPTFSLWYVTMIHDFLMWRGDTGFLRDRMPGVRSVLEAFRRYVNKDGLVESPAGWNFIDWVPVWDRGCPPDGDRGVSASINLLTVLALRQAAEIEEYLGETDLSRRNRALADAIGRSVHAAFWDERRGLFADDLSHANFSEHSQCLALLSGAVPEVERDRVIQGLVSAPDLHRATIYFSHYLFEVLRMAGRAGELFRRLEFWFDLQGLGLKTTIETPEPSRSDCHGWGAHPMYHYLASIIGIRPGSPGFSTVRIEPQLGPLTWAKGTMPHPRGEISVDLSIRDGMLSGTVALPDGVSGELLFEGSSVKLANGPIPIALKIRS